jgi:hypothetical protein
MRRLFLLAIVLAVIAGAFACSMASAQDSAPNDEISRKLDKVLDGQRQMVDAVNAIREDMRILKIRVTQSQ